MKDVSIMTTGERDQLKTRAIGLRIKNVDTGTMQVWTGEEWTDVHTHGIGELNAEFNSLRSALWQAYREIDRLTLELEGAAKLPDARAIGEALLPHESPQVGTVKIGTAPGARIVLHGPGEKTAITFLDKEGRAVLEVDSHGAWLLGGKLCMHDAEAFYTLHAWLTDCTGWHFRTESARDVVTAMARGLGLPRAPLLLTENTGHVVQIALGRTSVFTRSASEREAWGDALAFLEALSQMRMLAQLPKSNN